MQPYFENHYVRNEAFFSELYSYMLFRRPVRIVAYSLLLLIFIIDLLAMIFSRMIWSFETSFFFALFIPLLFIMQIVRFNQSKKMRYQQDLEQNHGVPIESIVMLTENGVYFYKRDSKEPIFIDRCWITGVIETRNYYFLITRAKLHCGFRKDSFVRGTPDGFLQFLRATGLKT